MSSRLSLPKNRPTFALPALPGNSPPLEFRITLVQTISPLPMVAHLIVRRHVHADVRRRAANECPLHLAGLTHPHPHPLQRQDSPGHRVELVVLLIAYAYHSGQLVLEYPYPIIWVVQVPRRQENLAVLQSPETVNAAQ